MSEERYYQDYNFDGWPIIDRDHKQEMSRKCLVGRLNKYESMLSELRTELEQERERSVELMEHLSHMTGIVSLHHQNSAKVKSAQILLDSHRLHLRALSAGEGGNE